MLCTIKDVIFVMTYNGKTLLLDRSPAEMRRRDYYIINNT